MKTEDSKKVERNLHEGHRESMRSKFRSAPSESMPDHELLEFLLFNVIPRKNTNEIAHELINRYDSFHGVFEADAYDLMRVKGIGERSALFIKTIYACIRRYGDSKNAPAEEIATNADAGRYFVQKLGKETREHMLLLLLDNSDRIIGCHEIEKGSVNRVSCSLQNLFGAVYASNAAGFYVAHNHPRGKAIPSREDYAITREIMDISSLLDYDFRDHIIVAGDQFIPVMESMRERR